MLNKKAQSEDMIQLVLTMIVLFFVVMMLFGFLKAQKDDTEERSEDFIDNMDTRYFLLNLLRTEVNIESTSMSIAEFIPLAIEDNTLMEKLRQEVNDIMVNYDLSIDSTLRYKGEKIGFIDTYEQDFKKQTVYLFYLPSLDGNLIQVEMVKKVK